MLRIPWASLRKFCSIAIRVSIVDRIPRHLTVGEDDASPIKSSSDWQIASLSMATFVKPVLKILVRTGLKDFWSWRPERATPYPF